jgi:RimJ/RimL family protein N-acetyltransferase
MPDPAALSRLLADRDLRLQPLREMHREPLRAACALDSSIWDIYVRNYSGAAFDRSFSQLVDGTGKAMFAILFGGTVVGMSGYLNIQPANRALEIGTTYLVPDMRGTGVNVRMKRLMIGQAFACGFDRIEFRVDTRNARSLAALDRLGAVREGVLRRHVVTWTGHVRDSAIYSILRGEWSAAR